MSLPRARSRKKSESERGEKSDSDKKKLGSGHATPKNGKTGSPAHSKSSRRSSIVEHPTSPSKLEPKRRTTSDSISKPTHTGNRKLTLLIEFNVFSVYFFDNSSWKYT